VYSTRFSTIAQSYLRLLRSLFLNQFYLLIMPKKLNLTSPVREPSPNPLVTLSPEGLRHLCMRGPSAEISDLLNNRLPTFGTIENSLEAYRPAQCEAARARHISVLEGFHACGCPLLFALTSACAARADHRSRCIMAL